MTKIIRNADTELHTYAGQEILPGESYEIQMEEMTRWSTSSALLVDVANGKAIVNDGTNDIVDVNAAIDFLKDKQTQNVAVAALPPFAAKTVGTKKLYKRVHGIYVAVGSGETEIPFACPYPNAKIEAIQILGGQLGDSVDLMVHDTPTGTVSGIPNFKLNQFGFSVCVAPEVFTWTSRYDADLIKDLTIMLVYRTTNPKNIGVSFDINEVK